MLTLSYSSNVSTGAGQPSGPQANVQLERRAQHLTDTLQQDTALWQTLSRMNRTEIGNWLCAHKPEYSGAVNERVAELIYKAGHPSMRRSGSGLSGESSYDEVDDTPLLTTTPGDAAADAEHEPFREETNAEGSRVYTFGGDLSFNCDISSVVFVIVLAWLASKYWKYMSEA